MTGPGAMLPAQADQIRLAAFLAMLAGMMLWELAAPWRRAEIPRLVRWSNNLALVFLDGALVRLVFPVAAVGAAIWAADRGFGLLPLLGIRGLLAAVLGFLVLDLAVWVQHRVFHAVPLLWRLHRVHHADPEIDATTGLRFHPAEVILSMAIKVAVVVALGVPALAVLVFEVVLNASSIFNHANVRLPAGLDHVLRLAIVTPDVHRVHHSVRPEETNSNFGFNLTVWDRAFGTYRAAPRDGRDGVTIGLGRFGGRRDQWLDRLLLQPLRGAADDRRDGDGPVTKG